MKYPEYVKKILDAINEAGFEAFAVGGAVRDFLLEKPSHDYDLTTSALPEETAEIFKSYNVIKTGLKHGTVTVISDGHPVEITTYRIDGDYKDSRHPTGVHFTRSLEEDLARRDFTVNAMAHNEKRGLVDLFGGASDLDKRLIRAVGNPRKRFEEDALRIMRAFRFCSKLDFDIEENTFIAAKDCAPRLINISAERKSAELEGILLGLGAKKALRLMHEAGVFEVIAPMLSLDTTRFDSIDKLSGDFACRMAFCLIGQENYENFISALRLSNAVSARIKKLVRLSESTLVLPDDKSLRRFMAECGDELEDVFMIRAALGESVEDLRKRAKEIKEHGDCLYLSELKISGRDLSDIGINGKDIGEALSYLLDAVHGDPSLNNRDALLNLIKKEKNL